MRFCKPCGPAPARIVQFQSVPGAAVGRNALVGNVLEQSQATAYAREALGSGDLDRICAAARDLWRAGYLDLASVLEREAQDRGYACRVRP